MYRPSYFYLILTLWIGQASSISSPPRVAQERWERVEDNNDNYCSAQQSTPSSSCCGFFVWNVPSAICYHWGTQLKYKHTTEGRGGVKYVRIDKKGLLKYFWPCSRFRPDACAICGHSWTEHLLLHWPTKDSALDRYLETKPSQVTRFKDKESLNDHSRHKANVCSRSTFHRNYVTDREQLKPKTRRGPFSRLKRDMNRKDNIEWRESKGVYYSIPKLKDSSRKKKGWGWSLAYELVLGSLDDLITIEKLEEGTNNYSKGERAK